MYVPRGGGMKKYNPQCCVHTGKGKSFTCNDLALPENEICNFCKGNYIPVVVQEEEEDHHTEPPFDVEAEVFGLGETREILESIGLTVS